ncbi:amphiphysin-like isoform X2 [Lineus longissimus]|uniref:amphiphysin-like isoform X2 n=1 Tax=Lineus longissimus TaxID=88925 RepID=UPI00315D3B44
MAEGKGGLFAKRLQKQIVRAKAKVLQNLGKAEKTRDEEFDVHVNNFHKQQHDATRLQKELKKYIDCAKEMSHANKAFYEVLTEVYESEWVDKSVVQECGQSLELLWMDYIQKLTEQVMAPLNKYIATFQETKTKISKRGRKLVDYDNSRHNVDELLNQKKKDESKLAKSHEDLESAKRIFDELNDDLHNELPNLYDKRIQVYSENFTNLYDSETTFHVEAGKLKAQLQEAMEKLNREFDKGSYGVKRSPSHVSSMSNRSSKSNENSPNLSKFYNVNIPDSDKECDSDSIAASNTSSEKDHSDKIVTTVTNDKGRDTLTEESRYEPVEVRKDNETPTKQDESKRISDVSDDAPKPADTHDDGANGISSVYDTARSTDDERDDDLYQVPGSNKEVELPDGVEYMVIVSHSYEAGDEDELALEPGDIVYVVPFENPEEQDDGWLSGYKKDHPDERGVFPQNFTKRL